jgi:hypothetical protein
MSRVRSVSLALVLGVTAHVSAQTPTATPPLELAWKVGDRWVFTKLETATRRDRGVTVEKRVLSSGPEGYVTQIADETAPIEERVLANGTHIRAATDHAGAQEHIPVAFPLKPGSRWDTRSQQLITSGNTLRREARCTAGETTTVTVPAGSFEAVEIECKGWWNLPQGYSGRYEVWAWYAPKARWFAKMRVRNGPPGWGGFQSADVVFDVEYQLKSLELTP